MGMGETYTPGFRQARLSDLNDGLAGAAVRPETALTIFSRRLVDLHERAAHLTVRLSVVNDRVFGPIPQTASNGKDAAPAPVAMVDELHALIDRLAGTVHWLETEVERAERL